MDSSLTIFDATWGGAALSVTTVILFPLDMPLPTNNADNNNHDDDKNAKRWRRERRHDKGKASPLPTFFDTNWGGNTLPACFRGQWRGWMPSPPFRHDRGSWPSSNRTKKAGAKVHLRFLFLLFVPTDVMWQERGEGTTLPTIFDVTRGGQLFPISSGYFHQPEPQRMRGGCTRYTRTLLFPQVEGYPSPLGVFDTVYDSRLLSPVVNRLKI